MKYMRIFNILIFGLILSILILLFLGVQFFHRTALASSNDLDDETFLSTFTSNGGNNEMLDGELCYTIMSSSNYLEADISKYTSGSRWYVPYVTARNTLTVHLKNESDAVEGQLWLHLRNKDWDSKYAVSFTLKSDGNYNTYYINYSALELTAGQIVGFRFYFRASSGAIYIDHLSFEREKDVYSYAGQLLSCTADGTNVKIEGMLNEEYAGSSVLLYRTDISNMMENLNESEIVATTKTAERYFTISIPFHDGEVTLLSSCFLLAVDGVKVCDMFTIENYESFTENPYAFTLNELCVNVYDYGAKGDAFTDDTSAIQSAIDDVSERGGGTVIISGDDTEYGIRYVVTTIWMKDNVELRIENGAVLWQSWRESDYPYSVSYGHDMDGVTWGHNGLAMNFPLIYSNQADNVKITGGGTIRMLDIGSTSRLAVYSGSYSSYCQNLIHLVPIGCYNSTNVEITDITILRTSCYHLVVYGCTNVYIANITMSEDNCLSGDGISIGLGSKNIIVDRCFLFTDDDAIVIVSHSIGEKRGITWWRANEDGEDNRVQNIIIRHSVITPGNIIVLITWGTDASDLTWQTINGLYIYDNILGSYDYTSYCFNLYPGQGGDYGEAGTSVPVHNVRIYQNSYRGTIENLAFMIKTNWISDSDGVDVVTQFVDTSFDYYLAYWDFTGEYKKDVFIENGSAVIAAEGVAVWQGIELAAGENAFTVTLTLNAGDSANLFVKDAATETIIAQTTISEESQTAQFTFQIPVKTTYLLGVENSSGIVSFYGASVMLLSVANDYFEENFDGDFVSLVSQGWVLSDEDNLRVFKSSDIFAMARLGELYSSFDLSVDFLYVDYGAQEANSGGFTLKFRYSNAQCYVVNYDVIEGKILFMKYSRGEKTVLVEMDYFLEGNKWYQLGLVCNENFFSVYINGEKLFDFVDDESDLQVGLIEFSTLYIRASLDHLCIAETNTLTFSTSSNWMEDISDSNDPIDPTDPFERIDSVDAKGMIWLGIGIGIIVIMVVVFIVLFLEKKGDKNIKK